MTAQQGWHCLQRSKGTTPNQHCSLTWPPCLQANFELDYITDECPHKHDLGLSVPNEFLFLAPDTLVIGVFRCAPPLQPCQGAYVLCRA